MGENTWLTYLLMGSDTLCKIGEGCGELLDIDAKTERMEELQWARIRVRIKEERIPNMVDIWAENMCYSQLERERVRVRHAEGKRVMENEGVKARGLDAGGGWDVEADSWGGATHGLSSRDGWVAPRALGSFALEKNDMRRLSEAELIQNERSLTDLALAKEAMRYDKVFSHSDCLVSGTPSFPSPFFGWTPVGEYCDLSGDDKERDEGENPIQMIMGTKSPTGENVECWDLVEVNKSRIEDAERRWS
ncbi:hypothetical protein CK203_002084 [Vitis vinifera]|uniref:Uncharacterized protein n=1 Tax=Vitis vinifera TaxID=29760 RepID=A0A438KK32_VITVI|nr:hypothetical protein CK203_002084 [Vitis vinifera]